MEVGCPPGVTGLWLRPVRGEGGEFMILIVLWLLGVPLGILVLLWLLGALR